MSPQIKNLFISRWLFKPTVSLVILLSLQRCSSTIAVVDISSAYAFFFFFFLNFRPSPAHLFVSTGCWSQAIAFSGRIHIRLPWLGPQNMFENDTSFLLGKQRKFCKQHKVRFENFNRMPFTLTLFSIMPPAIVSTWVSKEFFPWGFK